MSAGMNFQKSSITLAAGEAWDLQAEGTFVACVACDQSEFDLRFDAAGTALPMTEGERFSPKDELGRPVRFRMIRVENTSGSTMTVTLLLGDGDWQRFVTELAATISGAVALDLGDTFTSGSTACATGAATQVATGLAQKKIWVSRINDGGGMVYLTDSGAAGAEGIPLPANTGLEIEAPVDLYIRNDSGASVTVYTAEVS